PPGGPPGALLLRAGRRGGRSPLRGPGRASAARAARGRARLRDGRQPELLGRALAAAPRDGEALPAGAVARQAAGRAGLILLFVLLSDPLLELIHHRGVSQRRHVTQLAVLADVAKQAAHDLAGARLGKVIGPDDPAGPRDLRDALRHVVADLLCDLV